MKARNTPIAGIRARITVVMVLATALSMALLSFVVAWGVRHTLSASITDYLTERLDEAQAYVEHGNLAGAVDVSGPFVVQVLDAKGQVMASSSGKLDNTPVIELEDDDDEPDDEEKTVAMIDAQVEASSSNEDAEDAAEDAVDAAEDASDAAEDAADAAEDAAEAAEDVAEAAEDAAEEASDDYDESDDDADDYDDDWDDDANSTLWMTRRLMKAVQQVLQKQVNTTQGVSPEIADIVARRLKVKGPYVVDTRQATYQGEAVTLVALASLAEAYEAATSALKTLALSSLGVVAAAAALTWFLVGRTLRPVEQMRASTLTIVQDGLSQRLDVPEDDRDLRALATTFNDLLSRAELSLVEQRRFVSDASHQLKSPIAAQRAMIETLRLRPHRAENEQVINDLARENKRLQGIVDDLLALARHDEGRKPTFAPVDLIDVIFEEVSSLQAHSSREVDLSGVEPVVIRGDAYMLSHALRNLLDNAARYANERIDVTCAERAGKVVITVSDDGPGIPEADRERVFERFVRLDDGGERSRTSTGLGLSVVRGIVESHEGRVYLEEADGGGTRAVIELPAVS